MDGGTAASGITRWDIAAGLGLSRQTLSRAPAQVEDAGAIALGRGDVRVLDLAELRAAGTV